MTIGKAIKLARVAQDIKQKDLAKAVGISPKHLSQIENGAIEDFSVQIFKRLCQVLHADPRQLLELSQAEQTAQPTPG